MTVATGTMKRVQQKPARTYVGPILRYALLIAIGVILFTPFILASIGSFKTDAEIIAWPPKFLPAEWLAENWSKVWTTDIGTAFLSVTTAIIKVIACSMAAYAFSRLQFPGRDVVFNFMLASMMIPGAITMIPAYVLMGKLKLLNTYWSLILPGIIDAGGIFMLTQFFKSIPRDLEEAAHIDGADQLQIYKDVILPLARPALLTVFILQFQAMWNNFLTPLLYLDSPRMWVLNVALSIFKQQYKAQWNLTLVGAMFNAIPVLVLFFMFSKYYIEGVAYAGVKG
jgi:multiple sugar transport system permease protein